MSLVAYGASDDSETSDVEESETSKPTESGDANDREFEDDGKISDEDDYVPTARIQSADGSSSTNHTSVVVSSTNEIGLNRVTFTPSALSDLPAPKAATSSSQGGEDGEDELEEEVKPKASQLADAPKPPPKKAKQPTRIVLPALKKDSDDEEDDSQKKPKKPPAPAGASGSRSGLFALLPAPTHTSRKQANRPLIPYTLTKRPSASKPTPPATTATTTTKASSTTTSTTTDLPSQKHQSAFNALTGYESDSDDEEGGGMSANFFSIGNEAEGATPISSGLSVVKNSAPALEHEDESRVRIAGVEGSASGDSTAVESTRSQSPLASKPVSTVLESPVSSSSGTAASASEDSSNVSAAKTRDSAQDSDDGDDGDNGDDNEVSSTVGVPQVDQDAPLTFSSSMQNRSWSTGPLTSPMFPEMYAAPLSSGASSYWHRQQHYAQDYNTEEEQQEASSSSSHDIQQYMEDEQFLRISGKRKRGQEDIQIIDANVDDHVDPSELMKGISEESSYQPHRKKENMPSMQQKRKKQITYLAFQAKERELELKNAWSQNRMTKNQARSKYGF